MALLMLQDLPFISPLARFLPLRRGKAGSRRGSWLRQGSLKQGSKGQGGQGRTVKTGRPGQAAAAWTPAVWTAERAAA